MTGSSSKTCPPRQLTICGSNRRQAPGLQRENHCPSFAADGSVLPPSVSRACMEETRGPHFSQLEVGEDTTACEIATTLLCAPSSSPTSSCYISAAWVIPSLIEVEDTLRSATPREALALMSCHLAWLAMRPTWFAYACFPLGSTSSSWPGRPNRSLAARLRQSTRPPWQWRLPGTVGDLAASHGGLLANWAASLVRKLALGIIRWQHGHEPRRPTALGYSTSVSHIAVTTVGFISWSAGSSRARNDRRPEYTHRSRAS